VNYHSEEHFNEQLRSKQISISFINLTDMTHIEVSSLSQPISVYIPYTAPNESSEVAYYRPYYISNNELKNDGLTFESIDIVNKGVSFTTTHLTEFVIALPDVITDDTPKIPGI